MSCHSSKAPQQTLRPQGPYGLFGKHERSSTAGHTETLEGAPGSASGEGTSGRRVALQPHPAGPTCLRLLPGPARPAAPPLALSRSSSRRAGPSFCLLRSHKTSQRLPFGILPPVPAPYLTNSPWFFLDWLASSVMSRTSPSFQRCCRPRSSVVGFDGVGGETLLGLFFVAEAAAAADISRRGGRCCTSKMAAPCRLEEL